MTSPPTPAPDESSPRADELLERLCVVLVEPQDDINIGTTVRACKNFLLRDLRLVRPRVADAERIAISAPKAQDMIAAMPHLASLEEALSDCHLLVATTARTRRDKTTVIEPREAAALAIHEARKGRKVAYLFGREDSGLPNEVVDRAHLVVTIPTNPDYSSLNLGQAVLLNVWELFRQAQQLPESPAVALEADPGDHGLAPMEGIERMLEQAEVALQAIEFFKTPSTRHVMRSVRQVFQRARLDRRELAMWHGIFKEIVEFMARRDRRS